MTDRSSRMPRVLLFLIFLLRVGLGIFFTSTALLKVAHLDVTAEFLTRSRLLPEMFSLPLACIGVAMELLVGICLLFRLSYRGATLWGCVMTAVFALLYAQAWARGLELSCNCLGTSHEIVNYPLDTSMRLLLLGGIFLPPEYTVLIGIIEKALVRKRKVRVFDGIVEFIALAASPQESKRPF